MNTVHAVIAIILFIVGLILIGVGVWRIIKDEQSKKTKPASGNLGWGLVIGGIILAFAGVIVFIAGRSPNVTVTKTKTV